MFFVQNQCFYLLLFENISFYFFLMEPHWFSLLFGRNHQLSLKIIVFYLFFIKNHWCVLDFHQESLCFICFSLNITGFLGFSSRIISFSLKIICLSFEVSQKALADLRQQRFSVQILYRFRIDSVYKSCSSQPTVLSGPWRSIPGPANPCKFLANSLQNPCKPLASPCKSLAPHLQNHCKLLANLQNPSKSRASPSRKPCENLAKPMQNLAKPVSAALKNTHWLNPSFPPQHRSVANLVCKYFQKHGRYI